MNDPKTACKRLNTSLCQPSPEVRRTSSQYHAHCVPEKKKSSLTPPKSEQTNGTISPKNGLPKNSVSPSAPCTPVGRKSPSNRTNSSSYTSPDMTSTPVGPLENPVGSMFTTYKSNLLYQIGQLFDKVPIDEQLEELRQFEEGQKDISFGDKTLSPPVSRQSPSSDYDPCLLKMVNDSWKSLTNPELNDKKTKVPIASRIVLLSNNICKLLQSNTPSDLNSKFNLLMNLSNLRELSTCWLIMLPIASLTPYEEAIDKLISSCHSAVMPLDRESSPDEKLRSSHKISLKALGKLIFMVGKRLLDINASLDESIWSNLEELVSDNLVKGSSTQFSITLHSLIDQVSTSQMHASSLSYDSHMKKKSESIRSFMLVSVELLDGVQDVLRNFKMWHENHCGENTLSKDPELQFSWNAENFQYMSNLKSLIINYTQNIMNIVADQNNVSDLPSVEKVLGNIRINLTGIQRSLPFSSEDSDLDQSGSFSFLANLESSIRSAVAIIGKQTNLINTSFICCKESLGESLIEQ
ncbi:uncharacterized protein LOC141850677 isoform X2 [Brevipalpus obovatus]|uniref:uncharacterized protein LOC141850677 isoform X2 n=1 Tax=Brevipalpus obovatus TaxID=246614 RepID=UPI003D9ED0EB